MSNYLKIHKNKKPKKLKYSKTYSKIQIRNIEELGDYFVKEINRLNKLKNEN